MFKAKLTLEISVMTEEVDVQWLREMFDEPDLEQEYFPTGWWADCETTLPFIPYVGMHFQLDNVTDKLGLMSFIPCRVEQVAWLLKEQTLEIELSYPPVTGTGKELSPGLIKMWVEVFQQSADWKLTPVG